MIITFITDPLNELHPSKDGTLALAKEVTAQGHAAILIEDNDITYTHTKKGEVIFASHYTYPFTRKNEEPFDLSESDIIMMRIDPPFNMNYIYHTYLLEQLQTLNPKIKVLNPPHVLRSWNEKMAILNFPSLIPPTLVSKKTDEILQFSHQFPEGIILKPLDQKGGTGITWLKSSDTHQVKLQKIEKLTHKEKEFIMAQKYLKEAVKGDKRITVVNGEIINCILRVPKEGDFRGNISKGAKAYASNPTAKELHAVKIITKELKKQGVFFAGLDFIGEHLTELNITSPIVGFTIFPESTKKIIEELAKVAK